MKNIKLLLVLIFLFGSKADQEEDDLFKDGMHFLELCGERSLSICFKERALSYLEHLPSSLEIADTIIIKKVEDNSASRRMTTTLPDEPSSREEMLDKVIGEKIYDFFSTHTFELKMPGESINDFKRSFEDEARKKKKKGVPIMMLLQLKAAAIGAIMLKIIGLVAFKALLVAKVALTIATLLGLKKLLESKSHSSYEVVAHPVYSEEHGHYDRSFDQELAYKGHLKRLIRNT
nr:uncharacterized protein LOC111427598 [Onthophagus taurus]